MIDPKAARTGENATTSGPPKLGGLDQLDWLMIVASVLLGTVAKQHRFLDLPDGFHEWFLPFLLMAAGYKARAIVSELIEGRRARAKNLGD